MKKKKKNPKGEIEIGIFGDQVAKLLFMQEKSPLFLFNQHERLLVK